MGRDELVAGFRGGVAVSIHAPAWDATAMAFLYFSYSSVSIHAPAWDATEDLIKTNRQPYVSIHAPAWDAT